MMTERVCIKCGASLPSTEFYRSNSATDGLRGACKECVRSENRANAKAKPEERNARVKAWRKANPDAWREIQRKARAKRKAKKLAENHKQCCDPIVKSGVGEPP